MGDPMDEIRAAHAIDPEWMTAVLQRAGVGVGNAITAIDDGSIGTGQMGDNVRFTLTWRDPDEALPRTVVGKFPSLSDTSRATAVMLNSYRQEVGFYRDLRADVTIRAPHVYHAGWHDDGHDFVLVMEDVAPARQGDQLAGCTVEHAEMVIDQAVGLHAPTWGRGLELAERIDWLNAPGDERNEMTRWLLGHTWPGFVERYADRLSADELAIGATLVEHYMTYVEHLSGWAERHDAWAVTHGDYRLDNLLFGDGEQSPEVTVVDWQTIGVGIGPLDVAYFCGAGLLPAVRVEHERALAARYAAGLRAAGVDVTDEAVWDGYVLGSASGYFVALVASQLVERTERGDDMFVAMASRHAHQIRTVGLLEVLGVSGVDVGVGRGATS
jgi:hypothetical protein